MSSDVRYLYRYVLKFSDTVVRQETWETFHYITFRYSDGIGEHTAYLMRGEHE